MSTIFECDAVGAAQDLSTYSCETIDTSWELVEGVARTTGGNQIITDGGGNTTCYQAMFPQPSGGYQVQTGLYGSYGTAGLQVQCGSLSFYGFLWSSAGWVIQKVVSGEPTTLAGPIADPNGSLGPGGNAASFLVQVIPGPGNITLNLYSGSFNTPSTSLLLNYTDNSPLPSAPNSLRLYTTNQAVFDKIVMTSVGSSPPGAPTLNAPTVAAGTINLSWPAVTGATSYSLFEGTSAGGESGTPVATGITATSFSVTGLAASTTYFFKLYAINSAGTSPASNEVSATTPALMLAANQPYVVVACGSTYAGGVPTLGLYTIAADGSEVAHSGGVVHERTSCTGSFVVVGPASFVGLYTLSVTPSGGGTALVSGGVLAPTNASAIVAEMETAPVGSVAAPVTLNATQAFNNTGQTSKAPVTIASTDITGLVGADVQTIKTQAVTASSAVTFPASIGTSTYSGGSITLAATQAFNNTGQTSAQPANLTEVNGVAAVAGNGVASAATATSITLSPANDPRAGQVLTGWTIEAIAPCPQAGSSATIASPPTGTTHTLTTAGWSAGTPTGPIAYQFFAPSQITLPPGLATLVTTLGTPTGASIAADIADLQTATLSGITKATVVSAATASSIVVDFGATAPPAANMIGSFCGITTPGKGSPKQVIVGATPVNGQADQLTLTFTTPTWLSPVASDLVEIG